MAQLTRKTEEEKEVEQQRKAEERASAQAERAAADAALAAHLSGLIKWEYQVKRIGEKQKGLTGSTRMEQIFNAEGLKGWELVNINEERATFKRPLPS